ncbi:uncharacterized protein LOC122403010 isoform X1 [Colletes gigas]|uniref:uncharacterized protein LOC122403010 isoform X1 n=2 Tax=Colletes gigas TaxID=935657 RepID=UPI001C9A5156|nr:uncharacterized protein LOC122403010 isoform X1 [Colletes gigas]
MAKYTWTREKTFQLIHLYEKNALLWDKNCKEGCRKREKKIKIISDIANRFNTTMEEISRKLHNLRNQVSQELNRMKKKNSESGTDEIHTSNWPYFSSLKFLVPGLTKRSPIEYMPTSNIISHNGLQDQISGEKESNQCPSHEQEESKEKIIEISEQKKGKKRTKSIDEENYKDAVQILSKEPDDYDTFGEYVAMELRSLRSNENKRRLKAEIRRAICRIADIDDASIYTSGASSNSSPVTYPLPSPSTATYYIP